MGRRSCDDVVLLALLPKFCYSGNEALERGFIKVANYTPTVLKGKQLTWTLTNGQDQVIAQNNIPLQINQGTLAEVGPLNIVLPAIQEAETYTLRLAIEGTEYSQSLSVMDLSGT